MLLIEKFIRRSMFLRENLLEVEPFIFVKNIFKHQKIYMRRNKQGENDLHPGKWVTNSDEIFQYSDPYNYAVMGVYKGKDSVKNLHSLPAFVLDVDSINEEQLGKLVEDIRAKKFPASYIVNSGRGIHIYIQFDNPVFISLVPLESMKLLREKLKMLFAKRYAEVDKCASLHQAYRMPGFPVKPEISLVAKARVYTTKTKYTLRELWDSVKSVYVIKHAHEKEEPTIVNPDYSKADYADPDYQLQFVEESPMITKRFLKSYIQGIKTRGIKVGSRNVTFLAFGAITSKAHIPYCRAKHVLTLLYKLPFNKLDFSWEEARDAFCNGRHLIYATKHTIRKWLGIKPREKKKTSEKINDKVVEYLKQNTSNIIRPAEVSRFAKCSYKTAKKYIIQHSYLTRHVNKFTINDVEAQEKVLAQAKRDAHKTPSSKTVKPQVVRVKVEKVKWAKNSVPPSKQHFVRRKKSKRKPFTSLLKATTLQEGAKPP